MWLINTSTYKLHEFVRAPFRRYAILSHRWGTDEVKFEEYQNRLFESPDGALKNGWKKIKGFCDLVARRNVPWAWVDTCCINKTSSVELQEAINSMFTWYRHALVCVVYLEDVWKSEAYHDLPSSEWFSRGWTLQELLAPQALVYHDRAWNLLGSRKAQSCATSKHTGIPEVLLSSSDPPDLSKVSIAQRFQWASTRKTTREEDAAYCLMGIFNVNMPLLYGEGQAKAFRRLQLEILKDSDDETIFAWDLGQEMGGGSILAPNAIAFRGDRGTVEVGLARDQGQKPFSITNKGLSIQRTLYPYSTSNSGIFSVTSYLATRVVDAYIVPINCVRNSHRLALFLGKMPREETYIRIAIGEIQDMSGLTQPSLRDILILATNNDNWNFSVEWELAFGRERQRSGEMHAIIKGTILQDIYRMYPPKQFGSALFNMMDFSIQQDSRTSDFYLVTPRLGPGGADEKVKFEVRMSEFGFSQERIDHYLRGLKSIHT